MMLKSTILFFASSIIAVNCACANETKDFFLANDVNIEITEGNLLACEEAKGEQKTLLSCEEEILIVDPTEIESLACNSCKGVISCSCHSKGKTKDFAQDSSADVSGISDNLACACISSDETEV